MLFDVEFDFTSDAGGGDPDATSPTLRAYHKLLWSKSLPNGKMFGLVDTEPGYYLLHRSELGKFHLASDSAVPTWTRWERMKAITRQIPEETRKEFYRITFQIGAMIVFPRRRVDNKPSINQERGYNGKIADRLDLTVECIRRHYVGEESPLSETLARYASFFSLFGDFKGYTEFFLLQDLVSDDLSEVNCFLPFDGFKSKPLPASVEAYEHYRRRAIEFVKARNDRMTRYVQSL